MKKLKRTPASQLAEPMDTSEFDKEFVMDTFRPMTADERAEWEQIKARPGRPRKGRGAKVISVSVEKELLSRSDRLAKRLGISRAELIARGLQDALVKAGDES